MPHGEVRKGYFVISASVPLPLVRKIDDFMSKIIWFLYFTTNGKTELLIFLDRKIVQFLKQHLDPIPAIIYTHFCATIQPFFLIFWKDSIHKGFYVEIFNYPYFSPFKIAHPIYT